MISRLQPYGFVAAEGIERISARAQQAARVVVVEIVRFGPEKSAGAHPEPQPVAPGFAQARKPEARPRVQGDPMVAAALVRGREHAVLHVEPLQQTPRLHFVLQVGANLPGKHVAVAMQFPGLEPRARHERPPNEIPGRRTGHETVFLPGEKAFGGHAIGTVPIPDLEQQGFVHLAPGVDIALPQAVRNIHMRRIRIAGRAGKFLDPQAVLHVSPNVVQFDGELRRPAFRQESEAAIIRDGHERVPLQAQQVGRGQKISRAAGVAGTRPHENPPEKRHFFKHFPRTHVHPCLGDAPEMAPDGALRRAGVQRPAAARYVIVDAQRRKKSERRERIAIFFDLLDLFRLLRLLHGFRRGGYVAFRRGVRSASLAARPQYGFPVERADVRVGERIVQGRRNVRRRVRLRFDDYFGRNIRRRVRNGCGTVQHGDAIPAGVVARERHGAVRGDAGHEGASGYVGQRFGRSARDAPLAVEANPVNIEYPRPVRGIIQPLAGGVERRRTFVRVRGQYFLRLTGMLIGTLPGRHPVYIPAAAPRKRQVDPFAVRMPDRLGGLRAVIAVREAPRLAARRIQHVQVRAAVGLPQKRDLRTVRAVGRGRRAQVVGQALRFFRVRIEPVQIRIEIPLRIGFRARVREMISFGMPGYGPPYPGFRFLRIAQRAYMMARMRPLHPMRQVQPLRSMRRRLARLPIQNVQGRKIIVFALVGHIREAAPVGRKTGMKIAEAFRLEETSLDRSLPNRRRPFLVFAAKGPHPVRVRIGGGAAGRLFKGLFDIPDVPSAEFDGQPAQNILPVRSDEILRESKPLIVDRLSPQTGMGIKSAHFDQRELLARQHAHPQRHVPVAVPVVVAHECALILRRALRQPGRVVERRHGPGQDGVGVAVQHVRPFHVLVSQILKIQERQSAARLHRRLHLHDVREFVRNHVPQPVVIAAQRGIEGRRPYLDLVVEEPGRAVGIILEILEHERHLALGLELIQRRDRAIHFFRDAGDDAGRAAASPVLPVVMENHLEMLGFYRIPVESGPREIVQVHQALRPHRRDDARAQRDRQRSEADDPARRLAVCAKRSVHLTG